MDNQTSTLAAMNTGDSTMSPQSAAPQSNALLIQNRQPLCRNCDRESFDVLGKEKTP